MTVFAICATRQVSRSQSLYRGEQYDSDLGLYYLRGRYYNPATGRFMSRDPEDGKPIDPKTLHKYLYAGGDPVNGIDPTGRDLIEYVVLTAKVIYESRELIIAAATCAAALTLDGYVLYELVKGHDPSTGDKLGAVTATIVCAAGAGPLLLKEFFL